MEGCCFFFFFLVVVGGLAGFSFSAFPDRLFFFFLSLLRGAPRAQESAATWPRVSLLFITSADVHNFRERHLLLFPLLPLFPPFSRKKKRKEKVSCRATLPCASNSSAVQSLRCSRA